MFLITFRNYLNLENGKNLPKPCTLHAILQALRLNNSSAQWTELTQAYFSAMDMDCLLPPPGPAAKPLSGFPTAKLVEAVARTSRQRRALLPQRNLDQYLPLLDDTISLAEMYEDRGDGDSGLHTVEARVFNLFDREPARGGAPSGS